VISLRRQEALQTALRQRCGDEIAVQLGIRYGNPSINIGLEALRQQNIRRLIVLPLYPQYSATTTGSTFDAVADVLKTWCALPDLHSSRATTIIRCISGRERTLFAVTGQNMVKRKSCCSRFMASLNAIRWLAIRITASAWKPPDSRQNCLTYQMISTKSLFGREEWLKPYTDATLETWAEMT
jgi:ferrochelatase